MENIKQNTKDKCLYIATEKINNCVKRIKKRDVFSSMEVEEELDRILKFIELDFRDSNI